MVTSEDVGSVRKVQVPVQDCFESWDHYLISLAQQVSLKSRDPSTKVGAVVVGEDNQILSAGFNDFPIGVEHREERYERPQKYERVVHAEQNAVLLAARHGTELRDARLYMNFEPTPCTGCTKSIIQAGIKEVVGPDREFPGQRTETFHISEEMMKEAGVERRIVEYEDG